MQERGAARRQLVVVAVLAALPAVAAAGSVIGREWFPAGDHAVEVMRIADVGGVHTPLVGPWSRLGWAHPGPLLFWLLSPFETLFGPTGVLVGVGLFNAAACGAAVWVAARIGGIRLAALVAVVVLLVVRSVGPDVLVDPWNPWAAFLPFLLALVLAWAHAVGDRRALPALVAVGSFSVQAHAGYAPVVAAVVVTALVLHRPSPRALLPAVLVGVALWSAPIIDQLVGDGNLGAVVESSLSDEEPTAGWATAVGVMGHELAPIGPWLTGDDDDRLRLVQRDNPLAAIPLLVALGCVATLGRRRSTQAAALATIALVASAVGVLATSRVSGILGTYLVRWWWAIAAAGMLSLAWFALERWVSWPMLDRALIGASAVIAAVAVLDGPASLPYDEVSRALSVLGPRIAEDLDPRQSFLVRGFDARTLDANGNGLALDLERRGFDVNVFPHRHARLAHGGWRVASESEVDAVLSIVSVEDLERDWQAHPRDRLLARFDLPHGRGHAVFLRRAGP